MSPAAAPIVRVALFTHPGRARMKLTSATVGGEWLDDGNEDVIVAQDWVNAAHMYVPITGQFELDEPLLLMVADGMGGANAGEVASAMAARRLVKERTRLVDCEGVTAVVNEAHQAILAAGVEEPQRRGMGTTVAGLVLTRTELLWFNVGDSRVYRFRDGYLQRVSVDDVSLGERRRAREENRPSHLITACLGGNNEQALEPHCGVHALPVGSRWLVCTDGVSDVVPVEAMEACLRRGLLESTLELYKVAMQLGGPDNISILVVEILPPHARESE